VAKILVVSVEELKRDALKIGVAARLLQRFLDRHCREGSEKGCKEVRRRLSVLTRGLMIALTLLDEVSPKSVREIMDLLGIQFVPTRISMRTLEAARKVADRVLGPADPLKVLARLALSRA